MSPNQLQVLRDQIDEIDQQLIKLLVQRMQVVQQVGAYKKAHGIEPLDVKRFQQVLESKIEQGSKLGLSESLITDIYERIHYEALMLEEK